MYIVQPSLLNLNTHVCIFLAARPADTLRGVDAVEYPGLGSKGCDLMILSTTSDRFCIFAGSVSLYRSKNKNLLL